MESINGKESVEDLIAMVDRQDEKSIGAVIAMISMTTQFTNPATFNQFTKKLKQDRPEIYDKCKDVFSASGSNTSDTNNNSGCFVATATMKNYNHPIVLDLRNFRDLFLLKSWYGRLFVKSYYLVGPFFARLISKSKLLRSLSFNLLIVPIHNLIKRI